MKILSYKPLDKGFLRGHCTVETPSGLQIREIAIFDKNGHRWIAFPSRKYEDQGQTKYYPYLYLEAEKLKRFQNQLLDALDTWIKDNPVLAPTEHKEIMEEELPF